MLDLLSFRNEKIQTIPFGILGALLMFLVILGVEGCISIVYVILADKVLMDAPMWQSVVYNVGSIIGNFAAVATLYSIYVFQSNPNKIVRYRRKMALIHDVPLDSEVVESEMEKVLSNPFLGSLNPSSIINALPYLLLMVFSYRIAFDSLFGVLLEQFFPMDEDILKAFEYIFNVPILGIISVVIAAPIFEELFFRGFMMNGLRRKGYGIMSTAFITSGLFAVMHFNVPQGVNAFFLGLGLAYVYEKTNDLRLPIALHLINNLFAIIAYDSFQQWIQQQSIIFKGSATIIGIGVLFATLFILNQYFNKHQINEGAVLEEVV